MKPLDLKAENSTETIGRTLRRRPLARKKLSDMVEEELEQMIRRKEFAQDEQLPSERELMEFFYVCSLSPAWFVMPQNLPPTNRQRS